MGEIREGLYDTFYYDSLEGTVEFKIFLTDKYEYKIQLTFPNNKTAIVIHPELEFALSEAFGKIAGYVGEKYFSRLH
ncbi:ribosomal protein S17E [Anoxybacillus calidus]|uniref:Ribosomal protein S17E n=1 Tax=[Anoxybacillus] calidus TaxID=575178 RepID=A0A7W0BY82_9BACL|nr:hypothetical protein [Anoxybacillus calidus]MBA2873161.1 ribosomal protein S17E [Anoxybacillus calidus]